ncbi:GNAT family N-acetyltransferase [Lysinibacillus xylanilyticus]|uniref:GNAT family N-acetyltransferase n=1 Tax=Lysinibacillus xylanilyticus TaxID=582475 RepID=UPI002B255A55|nr:GNAT family N-acetyltransferase [Lysinibacillus xylanilyticus]MEB2302608.1 GNAT family N-acetyltransferase [Lysinibacillus xylanilyticus]
MFTIRNFENEFEFFQDMLYESIHIPENKPSKEVLLNSPGIRKYHEGWGRKGDKALIAVDAENKTVGAVWYRLFDNNNKSYGYIDGNTPEIGMAVSKEVRGRGVGTLLMHNIIQQAKDEGYSAISLSVDLENSSAIHIYQKLGFKDYEVVGTSKTMIYKF